MSLSMGPHTITVLRAPQIQADYGNATRPDWDHPTSVDVPGCSVQPVQADEYTIDRDTTTTRWQAWVPATADLEPSDRIAWNGQTYDVDGDVMRWDFPPLDHLVVILRRSEEATS